MAQEKDSTPSYNKKIGLLSKITLCILVPAHLSALLPIQLS